MSLSTRATLIAVPAALLLALAGCAPAGSGAGTTPGSSGAPSSGGAGGALASCVLGHTWMANIPDLANQLLAKLQASGSPATEATGEGQQTLKWDADGHSDFETNYTFTVKLPMGSGLAMTMKQHHEGPATGIMTLNGDKAVPSAWDVSGYKVTTAIDINGQSADSGPTSLPDNGSTGATLTVTCSGNTMTTFAEGGYATTKWTRSN